MECAKTNNSEENRETPLKNATLSVIFRQVARRSLSLLVKD